jgi:hypothetical protein
MTQSARDLENTFERSWHLLLRNWIIIVPPFIFGIIGGVGVYVVSVTIIGSLVLTGATSAANLDAVTSTVANVSGIVIGIIVSIVQLAYVTGMAGAAWRTGSTRFADGWTAFSHRGMDVFFSSILLFVIGFCAAVLAPYTFYVTLIAYMIFFIYTMASVILGERKATAAIVESSQLTLSNFWPTFAVVALIVVISALGSWIGNLISQHVSSLAGGVVTAILQQVTVAYASLVVAGEYLKLASATQAPPTVS